MGNCEWVNRDVQKHLAQGLRGRRVCGKARASWTGALPVGQQVGLQPWNQTATCTQVAQSTAPDGLVVPRRFPSEEENKQDQMDQEETTQQNIFIIAKARSMGGSVGCSVVLYDAVAFSEVLYGSSHFFTVLYGAYVYFSPPSLLYSSSCSPSCSPSVLLSRRRVGSLLFDPAHSQQQLLRTWGRLVWIGLLQVGGAVLLDHRHVKASKLVC
ncbi:hypothetical protein EYF80_033965 [Liparis tanakae]|uniref:Uncharacterized protein n=1 Tax=Liparis tanakae TaxID=230148 RepID=A0A4Z2GSN4_9TELE|nr:hypothetical protein EYF80_033965 [Liparis tanakae]